MALEIDEILKETREFKEPVLAGGKEKFTSLLLLSVRITFNQDSSRTVFCSPYSKSAGSFTFLFL
jgi:hypothetical protein